MNLEWCVHHHRDRAPQSQVVGAAPGIERGGVAKGRGERERARGVGEWAETDESHETLVLEGGRPTDDGRVPQWDFHTFQSSREAAKLREGGREGRRGSFVRGRKAEPVPNFRGCTITQVDTCVVASVTVKM